VEVRTLSPIAGIFARPVNLRLGTVATFVAVDLLLVAACLFALRQNVGLRGEVASEMALLSRP
jgi:hypothetical protein